MSDTLFERHRARLQAAGEALATRGYWSAFPEAPSGKIYGADAAETGASAFARMRDRPYELPIGAGESRVPGETSPFDGELGIDYPAWQPATLVDHAQGTVKAWRDAGIARRTGIALEILDRLNQRSFELAHAVMHTTGQGFVMAFQAGGPHAQDRGLEAVAMAYAAMRRVPATARFDKPAGKDRIESFAKSYTIAGRGVALVIACSTFPTWNSYGAIFANLVCGNPVIVKPHPQAILPLALTVRIAQEVLLEEGLPAAILQLAADRADAPITKELACHPAIRLIDYTGSNAFAAWLHQHASQAHIFSEQAGVNPMLVHGTSDYAAMLRNLAFSLSLYSGQMCTTPQNLYVPTAGITTDQGPKTAREFASDLAQAIDKLLGDAGRAAEVLGAIANPATLKRLEAAANLGEVIRPSTTLPHPQFTAAQARTPLLLLTDDNNPSVAEEQFGPIAFVVESADPLAAIARLLAAKGAITAAIYSDDDAMLQAMREVALDGGVALSENLLGGTFVNQSTAFSDFHGTGLNPAANAALTDEAFVTPRFAVVQRRAPMIDKM